MRKCRYVRRVEKLAEIPISQVQVGVTDDSMIPVSGRVTMNTPLLSSVAGGSGPIAATRGGSAPDGRKVKGTIHWVSAAAAIDAEVRLYDHLFVQPDPHDVEEGKDWRDNLNPDSFELVTAKVEPSLAGAAPGTRFQFERNGYFCVDGRDSSPTRLVFNRTVTLRDAWKRIEKRTT